MMCAIRKTLVFTGYLFVVLGCMSAFSVGAIFAETVINEQPTALTFYLARL